MPIRSLALTAAAATALVAGPVRAADVVFTGAVVNTCILNVSTPGVIAPAPDGTTLSSESGGGVAAVLAVTAAGTAPTLSFTAPALTTPAGFSGTATTAIRYTSTGGASQPYTSAASTARSGALLDVFTIHSRVTKADGFPSGSYTVRTTVTCQQ